MPAAAASPCKKAVQYTSASCRTLTIPCQLTLYAELALLTQLQFKPEFQRYSAQILGQSWVNAAVLPGFQAGDCPV